MIFHGINLLAFTAFAVETAGFPLILPRATSDSSAFNFMQRAAQLSSAAYTGCQGTAFDVTITKQIQDLATNAKGFVGYSESKKKISVVMKGSTTETDIMNDIDTTLVTPSLSGVTFPSGAQIMKGISSPWSSVHDDIISEVKTLVERYPDFTLESTGHSLGGSLTYISYVALASNFPDVEITSNAMAAYPIGNQAWADFADSLNGTLNRGTNVADGVPNMYTNLPYNYVHFGTEYYSSGTAATCVKCSGERDMSCSAGDGQYGVTMGHFSSFGVQLGSAGCGSSFF